MIKFIITVVLIVFAIYGAIYIAMNSLEEPEDKDREKKE
jgi:hypothetical protein